jgi:hypothetical protein
MKQPTTRIFCLLNASELIDPLTGTSNGWSYHTSTESDKPAKGAGYRTQGSTLIVPKSVYSEMLEMFDTPEFVVQEAPDNGTGTPRFIATELIP